MRRFIHVAFVAFVVLVALAPPASIAQDRTIPVPPNVTAQGLPPIPQSIADDLAKYADYRSATLLAWHPTARRLLIQTTLGNAPQIYSVDQPGGTRAPLTSYRDGASGMAAYDPADGGTFVFRKDVGSGTEANQLFRFDVATSAITLLTDGKSRHGEAVWARQGKWIAYDSTRRDGRDRDLYVMQPSDPKTERLVAEVSGAWSVADWSPDGRALVAVETLSAAETYLWRLDVASGEKFPLTPRGRDKVLWTNARFGPDGKSVYAVSDQDSDAPRLWRAEISSAAWKPLTKDDDTVEAFAISPDGALVAVVFDRDGTSALEIVDTASMKPRRTSPLPPGAVSRLAWRPGSSEIGFTYASVQTPGDVYSIDVPTGRLARWTASEVSFDATVLPPPEIARWKSFGGRTISGILYKPAAKFTGPRPVMINIHGGPFGRERARFQGRSNYFLNELGVAIIFPNVRGSDGFGKAFARLDDGVKREDSVKDIGALLDWIATRSDLDKRRVMVTGASYGGYMTLASAIAYGDRIRCAFAAAAISNFITFLESTEPSRQADRRAEYGDERDPKMREFLAAISPVQHAAELRAPLMIAHGATDTRVPLGQAEEVVQAATRNGASPWYVVYANVGHDNFPGTRANGDFNFYGWILFVQKFLLSRE